MNILFVCASNKDRSPALVKYFEATHPNHSYRSAGVNKYFTGKHGTHYLALEDIAWADMIVFAESVHLDVATRDFPEYEFANNGIFRSKSSGHYKSGQWVVLECGEYRESLADDYLTKAEYKLQMG